MARRGKAKQAVRAWHDPARQARRGLAERGLAKQGRHSNDKGMAVLAYRNNGITF